jgi:SOS-response transcriptional repressor LexA
VSIRLDNTFKRERSTLFGVQKALELPRKRKYRRRMVKKPKKIPSAADVARGTAMKTAREKLGLSQSELGALCGTTQKMISKFEHGLIINGIFRPKVEEYLGLRPKGALSLGERNVKSFTQPLVGNGTEADGLPVHATRELGEGLMRVTSRRTGTTLRPSYLIEAPKAYAIDMAGDTMTDRFVPGETLYVNPELPVRGGTWYVFYNGDRSASQVRYLVTISDDAWQVSQKNPPREYALSRAEWPIAERVAGTKLPD